jgi:polar amino acid transport system substrate-binding protein
MMKYLLLALSLGLPGTALAQGTLAEGKLAVGSDLTYPPYNYFADGNVPAGFDVEMMTEIARIMGVEQQFLDTRFENLILGVDGGQFDVIASTLYVNPDRAKQIDYIPYMRTGVSIAVAAASGLSFANPDELCGHVVGSIKGAAWLAEIAKLNETTCKDTPIDSREFPTSPEVTQALMSGGIEAQIEDSAVLAAAAQMLEGKVKVTTTENFYPVVVGLGVKKGNTALADAIRAALAEMNTSGFYPALLARYGVSQPSEEEFKAAIGE